MDFTAILRGEISHSCNEKCKLSNVIYNGEPITRNYCSWFDMFFDSIVSNNDSSCLLEEKKTTRPCIKQNFFNNIIENALDFTIVYVLIDI